MYARSTTVQADRESIDAGIAHVLDEVLPALQRMDGCVGLSLLVDRDSGRCIATSSWESKAAMRLAARPVGVIRDRATEILGGTAQVEEWEIRVMHRDHPTRPGAGARATWLRMDPVAMDRAVAVYTIASLPAMQELDGFCSASLLVNRGSGRAVTTTTYDTRMAMERTRERAAAVRSAGRPGNRRRHPPGVRVRTGHSPPPSARNGLRTTTSACPPRPPASQQVQHVRLRRRPPVRRRSRRNPALSAPEE